MRKFVQPDPGRNQGASGRKAAARRCAGPPSRYES